VHGCAATTPSFEERRLAPITLPRVALAIEERRLVPIILTSMGPSKTRPWDGPSTVYYVAEPYMLARDACIDLRSKAYRVPPVAAPST
jgi:hypothetical protein